MAEEIKEEVSKDLIQIEKAAEGKSKGDKKMAKEIKEEITEDLIQIEKVAEGKSKGNKKNEPFESRLRKFKRESSGIVSEVRKRESYESPSERRKKKSKEAEKRRHQRNGRFNSYKW